MLHHIDKTSLPSYSLEHIFSHYEKDTVANERAEQEHFAPQLTKASLFKTTADVIQAAKTVFKDTYLKKS